MSSTNKTTHYELSQYVGSDKPTYLSDYNGDMLKIDTGINTAKTTADSAATAATNAATAASTAQTTANTAVTNAATAQTTANGAISNIGDLTNLQTTNKNNLVTAINELILFAGIVLPYAGSVAPDGYLLCDGSAVSRTTYSKLFTAIGTTYGSGDGSTTFNVPNLKGRNLIGYDANDTDFNALGKTGGSKIAFKLTRPVSNAFHLPDGAGAYGDRLIVAKDQYSGNVELDEDVSDLEPYVVMNYIIKY